MVTKNREMGLYHMTFYLVLCSVQYTCMVKAQTDIRELPEGACIIDDAIEKDLVCSSDVKTSSNKDFYVEEQTYCYHETKSLCITCINEDLLEITCNDKPRKRQKRGFFRRVFRGSVRTFGFGGLAFGGFNRIFRRSRPAIVKTPPRITCPSIPRGQTAPPSQDYVVVTWGQPTTSDNENNIASVRQTAGQPSGSRFRHGRHHITFRVQDTTGLSASCTVHFEVVVLRCPLPSSPDNGGVQCPSTISGPSVVYGKTCTFACNTGYQLSGPATVECNKNGRFMSYPTCNKITCGTPPVPRNAKSVSCTSGHVYRSVCYPVCSQGYRPARNARLICEANRKWNSFSFICEDTVKPIFTKCPTKKINTIDRKFKWTVTATDNSGQVTLKQVQGHPPGSLLDYGVHFIKYVATDASGNSANCAFAVEMKESDCPRPSSNDTDIQFTCNGLTAESYCQISCKSKSKVKGSKYIACVQDKSQNNTSYWEPVHGQMATCHRRSCPPLNTPKNGALACDKQLGGTVCQIHCNEDYDISFIDERFHTFICGTESDAWFPRNTAPDCLELSFPDEYYLPTDFYYYAGDCSDKQALNTIKQQFIDNLNSIGISPCMTDVCSVDDIQVDCGDMVESTDFGFRRKRSINPTKRVLHVRVRFHVKNTNRTLSPAAADALLKSLVEKSKSVMSTNPAMRTMLSKALTPTISEIQKMSRPGFGFGPRLKMASVKPSAVRPVVKQVKAKSVAGKMSVKCKAGHAQTKAGVCVPCSVGSYANMKTNKCKPCPKNTYQDKPAMSSCQGCPSHHVTSSTGAANREQCKQQCRPDTFSPTGLVPCFPCPDGRYQSQYGSTTCQVCPESRVAGRVSQKCLQNTKTAHNRTDLKISNLLLTCESEICLSF